MLSGKQERQLQAYVLESITRSDPSDPLLIGSAIVPFVAKDDEDAKHRADKMLTDPNDPGFVASWHSGTAARILRENREITWKSFDLDSPYANWS